MNLARRKNFMVDKLQPDKKKDRGKEEEGKKDVTNVYLDKAKKELTFYQKIFEERVIFFATKLLPMALEKVAYGFNCSARYLRDYLKGLDESLDEALEKGDIDELIQRLQTADKITRKEIFRTLLKQAQSSSAPAISQKDVQGKENVKEKITNFLKLQN